VFVSQFKCSLSAAWSPQPCFT